MRDDDDAVRHHRLVGLICAIPFQHGEFRQMQVAAFAGAKHPRQFEYFRFTAASSFLAANSGEVRR